MIDAMQASIVLYRPHVARELTDVLPTLRTLVTPNEFDELSAALDKDESREARRGRLRQDGQEGRGAGETHRHQ